MTLKYVFGADGLIDAAKATNGALDGVGNRTVLSEATGRFDIPGMKHSRLKRVKQNLRVHSFG